MSDENRRIAQEGLRMIEENRQTAELLQKGLPDPKTSGPLSVYGVMFYPHPDDDCWRLYPARNAPE